MALVGNAVNHADAGTRFVFERGVQGRIERAIGRQVGATDAAIVYRYDGAGRLALARSLYGDRNLNLAIGYHADGSVVSEAITAQLGTAAGWFASAAAPTNTWSGTLAAGTPARFSFSTRDSELASTVKSPGTAGAIIYAVETSAGTTLAVEGAAVLGQASSGGKTVTLLRVTEAGLKLLSLTGTGAASLKITVAGDINRDGKIDGADTAFFAGIALPATDLNGDGATNDTDRQIAYANYGWRANLAPVNVASATPTLTHTDLGKTLSLDAAALDREGDKIFWRIVTASHGSATLAGDGQSILFQPEAGYVGDAAVTLQADDGYSASGNIVVNFKVSGAKLLALRLQPLQALATGQAVAIQATADFEDEKGVRIPQGSYLKLSSLDLSAQGGVLGNPLDVDDAHDRVLARSAGPALVQVERKDTDGRVVRAVAVLNIARTVNPVFDETGEDITPTAEPLVVEPDVYPGTISLAPGGTRQLKVKVESVKDGSALDVHTATQVVVEAKPASTETYTDPDTGEVFTYTIPALPQVLSGTRYLSSDESIATVSADGLITAIKVGQVTISVVHLASAVDETGHLGWQVIGQQDMVLRVQAAQTATVAGIAVTASDGGIVAAATGETVLIGPGALKEDAAVKIERIAVADIASTLGLPLPAPGALTPVAAFRLDIGSQIANAALQIALPLQGGAAFTAGEEVIIFRKGQVLTEAGMTDTWWVVDNGFIGADGVIRTASPPYPTLDSSGDYLVCKKLPGVVAGPFEAVGSFGDSMTLAGATFGFGLIEGAITSAMIGIIASSATQGSAVQYRFGVPQLVKVDLKTVTVDGRSTLVASANFPPAETPFGKVASPNVTELTQDGAGSVTLKAATDATATKFKAKIVVRALLPEGKTVDFAPLPDTGSFTVNLASKPELAKVALAKIRWQLIRQVPNDATDAQGRTIAREPVKIFGATARLNPLPDMAAVLTRTGIEFVRENKSVGSTNLLEKLKSLPLESYITGTKVQPIVYSDDLSTVFVGGKGIVWAIDTLTYKLLDTIAITGSGANVSSLATVGDLLIVGEGNRYGGSAAAAGNYRLLAINTSPGSIGYGKTVTIKNSGVEATPYGISGLSVGPDGKTLVVATPVQPNTVTLGDRSKRGNLFIFDLSTLSMKTGSISARVVAELPSDGISGKSPQVVQATKDPDRFLVGDVMDYNRGLGALSITRDDKGVIKSAKWSAFNLSQPGNMVSIDRLDIQRAQSAVLVKVDGVEYAIVSDDNYNFLDPYYKAQFEAPDFIYTPSGFPIAVGGSASAKKVAVGGKLGIIKDPFGPQPTFLGATLPLDGYGIQNLSVSPDSKVLLGQLYGGYSARDFWSKQLPHQSGAWDVRALITAALNWPEQDRLRKHIKLPSGAEQLIPTTGAAPAGTFFDPPNVQLAVEGNLGDVIKVDLKLRVARELLKLPAPGTGITADQQKAVGNLMAHLTGFDVLKLDKDRLSGAETLETRGLSMVLGSDGAVVSQTKDDAPADFQTEGTLFVAPNITKSNLEKLRRGESLADQVNDKFEVVFTLDQDVGDIKAGSAKAIVTVTAKDYAKGLSVFFGDRDLSNPGYSKITLKEDVNVGSTNLLDIYRVEQRLRYFGYGLVATEVKGVGELTVDGKIDSKEEVVIKLFEQIVNGKTKYDDGSVKEVKDKSGKKILVPAKPPSPGIVPKSGDLVSWLNAFNAPHWLIVGQSGGVIPTHWSNSPGTTTSFVTSWVYDLMVASNDANSEMGRTNTRQFSGASNLGTELHVGVGTSLVGQSRVHSRDKILGVGPLNVDGGGTHAAAYNARQWDLYNAISLSSRLRNPTLDAARIGTDSNAQGLNLQDQALLDFVSVFSAIQSPGADPGNPNGYYDRITIKNGNSDLIRKSLFGDGTVAGGVINVKNVKIGGTAKSLGSAMTGESLSAFMGAVAGVNYADWVMPLIKSMEEFGIVTPQGIAAFLAQIRAESGGMRNTIEDLRYTSPAAAAGKFSALGTAAQARTFYETFLRDGGMRGATQPIDWYTRGGNWTEANLIAFANEVYGPTSATGRRLGNTEAGDGWLYRGTGLKQLTGRFNTQQFANYVASHPLPGQPTAAQIMADPVTHIANNMEMAARSAAHYFATRINSSNVDALAEIPPVPFSAERRNGLWVSPPDPYSLNVSWRVGQDVDSFRNRWNYWQNNVSLAYAGGNPNENIRAALARLGIKTSGEAGFDTKFGIPLQIRKPVPIATGDALTAASNVAATDSAAVGRLSLFHDANGQGDEMTTWLSLTGTLAATLIAPGLAAAESKVMGVCGVSSPQTGSQWSIFPIEDANRYVSPNWINFDNRARAEIKIVREPGHGRIVTPDGWTSPHYRPDPGYRGRDSFKITVRFDGKAIDISYFVSVFNDEDGAGHGDNTKNCNKPQYFVSGLSASADLAFGRGSEFMIHVLGAAAEAASVSSLMRLGVLGESDGVEGRFQLDLSAAGHGWYLDPTPLDNTDDFLPTADTTIWRAKLGSAADGKMDLLSVLLHEYGHVLGLEHNADGSDFMAATLQPGARRLPTSTELAWMAQRVAELKAEQDGNLPADPAQPQPAYPSWGTASTATRQSRRSSNSTTGTATAAAARPQFATAVNATLTNGGFTQSGAAWTTQGDVRFTAKGAVLGEAGGRQARLLQGFALGASDKLLSFTIAGTGLAANASGPGDAFEVALLDADSGESVVGHVVLNGSDALLNRQTGSSTSTGLERLAATVRKTVNADGSTTYLVTLAPELAGRSVLLSFDLLGFATATSSVTVREVALLSAAPNANHAPTATDGAATGTEDTALALRWSDFHVADVDNTALRVVISSLPTAGTLHRQQADGSWAAAALDERFSEAELTAHGLRFVPAANASGDAYARIGYKAFDGELFSAQANLLFGITAVADVPTLQIIGNTGPLQGLEDTALTLRSIVASLNDIDGSETLVLTLSGLPAGFTLTDGTHSFSPSTGHLVLDLSGWQLTTLSLTAPHDFNGSVLLQVQATAIELSTGERATAQQDLLIEIVAVADAPLLSLSARDVSVSRELLATSFESVANANTAATVVKSATLEGWTVMAAVAGKVAAFEVWASGDILLNDFGNGAIGKPADGGGKQWLGLRNGGRSIAHQTLGIERSVATINGAIYTLSLDFAGGLGLALANTQVGIYVDGVRIAVASGTSPRTALSWKALSFQFTGNGQARKISLVLEGGNAIATSTATQRGALIDDIRLVETLPSGVATVYGLSGTDIALPQVLASLTDSFGSERLSVTLLGAPLGAVVSDGTRSVTVSAANEGVDLSGWNLTRLSLRPVASFTGDIALQVRATSRETSNAASASVSLGVTVKVLAGTAVATPVGVNPFITMAGGQVSRSSTAGSSAVTPLAASAFTPLAERGSVATPAALPTGRTPEEEALAEIARSHALSDAWLKALEERAKAQWQQLVGGR